MARRPLAVLVRIGLAVAMACTLVACGDDDGGTGPETAVPLDGSPRTADAAGQVVAIAEDFSSLTLDGDRTFGVADDLTSFSAIDGSIQPLLRADGQYVQVGLDGDDIIWLGAVSSVVEVPGEPAVAYFTDVLTGVEDGRAIFRSGTVLEVAGGVTAPGSPPVPVVATIDVATRAVVSIVPG